MGKKTTPAPPDLGPAAAASADVARMQQETAAAQLAWAKEQDANNNRVLQQVLDVQLPAMQQNADNAAKDRQRYETQFQPLEDNLIKEFQNYDTDAKRQEERGRAVADVTTAFDAQRRNALSRLEGYGVDPSQTRNAALDLGVRTQQAAAQAGAATNADRNTTATGRALRADAINIGRGMGSQVAQSYGTALQAGNSSIGNANATTGAGANALTSGNGAMGQALQGYGQNANIQSQGFGNQMQAYNAQQAATGGMLSGIGGLAGMAMMMADGGDVGGKRRALPVYHSKPGRIDYGQGDGSGIDDKVPILASKDEFIIPKDVVQALGTRHFDKLIEKYHTPADQQRRALQVSR